MTFVHGMVQSQLKRTFLIFSTVLIFSQAFVAMANDYFDELDSISYEDFGRSGGSNDEKGIEFHQFSQQIMDEYLDFKGQIEKEFEEFQRISSEELNAFQNKVGKRWQDRLVSNNTQWVEYSKDLRSRTVVDFEKETITISGDIKNMDEVNRKLKTLLLKNKAQAFAADEVSQNIEARGKKKIPSLVTAEVDPEPILLPIVVGKNVVSYAEVNTAVGRLVKTAEVKQETAVDGESFTRVTVSFADTELKSTVKSLPAKAQPFEKRVNEQAKKHNINSDLIFAVIESESAFNPMARSHIPAYGLMQIVPSSAGVDAADVIFGEPRVLSSSYLYNGDNNIEVGVTYLNILYYRYLNKIQNPESRLYCTIAAYNTGAGNVAKAFTGSMKIGPAADVINRLTPDQVYQTLISRLPYDETKQYLERVTSRMAKY